MNRDNSSLKHRLENSMSQNRKPIGHLSALTILLLVIVCLAATLKYCYNLSSTVSDETVSMSANDAPLHQQWIPVAEGNRWVYYRTFFDKDDQPINKDEIEVVMSNISKKDNGSVTWSMEFTRNGQFIIERWVRSKEGMYSKLRDDEDEKTAELIIFSTPELKDTTYKQFSTSSEGKRTSEYKLEQKLNAPRSILGRDRITLFSSIIITDDENKEQRGKGYHFAKGLGIVDHLVTLDVKRPTEGEYLVLNIKSFTPGKK